MADEQQKDKKQRSPAYPFIPLAQAIERAQQFWDAENRHPARVNVAAGHWGYKEKSSGALQTVSALKQHGLLEEEGSGDERRVKLTDLAKRILLDEVADSPKRAAALKTAALSPKLYADLFAKWGLNMPSDGSFRTYLRLDLGFNETAISDVMKNYKATLAFAKIDGSDKIPGNDLDDEDSPEIAVGDYVQWESQGALQFETPRKVTAIAPDGAFLFVEGTLAGIPMEQVTKTEPPPPLAGVGAANLQQPPKPLAPVAGVAREVSNLPEGEATLQWPATMSQDSVRDLEDWLMALVKKLKRRAGIETK